ncbi:MAG: serine/threonine-protein kinase [Actinomycetota bacterium]
MDVGVDGLEEWVLIGGDEFVGVYRAYDHQLGRTVAVRMLEAAEVDQRRRFEREGRLLAALDHHDNLVNVHYVDARHDGRPCLVMEHVAGGSLQDHLDLNGPVPPLVAVNWMLQIGSAVALLHRRGVVHRRLTPAAVLLSADDRRPKLVDVVPAPAGGRTAIAGYAPPEQREGDDPEAAWDLYALAATLHALLVGVPPPPPTSGASAPPRPPAPGGAALNKVLERALSADPDARFHDADDMTSALLASAVALTPSPEPAADTVAARVERLTPGVADEVILRAVSTDATPQQLLQIARFTADQRLLVEIAHREDEDVYRTAIGRLDQEHLALLLRESESVRVKSAAIEHLTDEEEARRFVDHPQREFRVALARTTDDRKLMEALVQDQDDDVVGAVIARARLPESLRVMVADADPRLRVLVARYGEHPEVIGELAEDPDPRVHGVAIMRLDDRERLRELATNGDRAISQAAFDRIDDESTLLELSRHELGHVREEAVFRIDDEALLNEIATDPDHAAHPVAIERLSDPDLLLGVARHEHLGIARLGVGRISRQADLRTLAADASYPHRLLAIPRLTDRAMLERLAKDGDREVRAVAARRLDEMRWVNEVERGERQIRIGGLAALVVLFLLAAGVSPLASFGLAVVLAILVVLAAGVFAYALPVD